MKRLLYYLVTLSILLLLGCSVAQTPSVYNGFHMNTFITLSVYGKKAQTAVEACKRRLNEIEENTSAFSNGDIVRLNNANGEWTSIGADAEAVLSEAVRIAALSGGAFDPTVRPVMLAWAYFDGTKIPEKLEIDAALKQVDYKGIELSDGRARLRPGQQVDLGGVAKGYAADQLSSILKENVCTGIINLGGNVSVVGKSPYGKDWIVGIQAPRNSSEILEKLSVSDTSVVTSGDYERFFEKDGIRYHHIIDPTTGMPARSGVISVSIIDPNSMLADASSTAVFVLGWEKGAEYAQAQGLKAILVSDSGEIKKIGF